jgi:pyruvate,orthophosphate dikinase
VLKEGDWCSLNGTTGEVIKGQQPVKKPGLTGDLATFMKWVDGKRRLKVLTNADTPEDAKVGLVAGGEVEMRPKLQPKSPECAAKVA